MENDNLVICNRCEGNACYKQVVNKITLYSCYGCGFQTSSIMKKGEKFFDEQIEILPELYKVLLGEDSEGNYEWAAVKAIKIKEEDKEKYPIPKKKGEFYEWRMDMTTEKRFEHKDFVEALDYINVFSGEKI